MRGFGGNDTYRVFNSGDVIVESTSQGGADKVVAAVDYKLGAGVDIEIMQTNGSTGTSAIDLTGNEFGQQITGNAGANRIEGKGGIDTLRGGSGADTFVFASTLGAANVDKILDFSVPADRMLLSDAIFTALDTGTLSAAAFRANNTGLAQDASDHIIYERDSGKLFYDADGAGGSAGVHFATLFHRTGAHQCRLLGGVRHRREVRLLSSAYWRKHWRGDENRPAAFEQRDRPQGQRCATFSIEAIGFVGSGFALLTYWMCDMLSLCIAAVLSCVFFIAYSALIGSYPPVVMGLTLLSVNAYRLLELFRPRRKRCTFPAPVHRRMSRQAGETSIFNRPTKCYQWDRTEMPEICSRSPPPSSRFAARHRTRSSGLFRELVQHRRALGRGTGAGHHNGRIVATVTYDADATLEGKGLGLPHV